MKWIYLFPTLLIGIFIEGCKQIKDPEFRSIDHFRIKSAGLQQIQLGFNVTYYNPNNFGVSVKEAEANIYIDSVLIGKFTEDEPVSVNKVSEFSIPLTGSVSYQNALRLNLQNAGERTYFFRADGTVKVGKAGVYISKPIDYSGTHKLEDLNIQLK
jgi:LEA14-like dessication related protein